MCEMCAATGGVLLSELERAVVLAEAEAGLGDPAARRPLSEAERASKVRFSEITALEDDYLAVVEPVLEGLRGVVDAEVAAALAGAVTAAQLLDALEALTVTTPPAVATRAQEAAGLVRAGLEDTYRGSSAVVLGEAARQGVTGLPDPLDAPAGAYEAAARRVAMEPWSRALEVVRRQAAAPQVLAGEVLDADLVPMALADYRSDGVIDLARQFAHGAIGGGRNDTFRAIPAAARYYASELLDGLGCRACAAVDQRDYDTLQDAMADYGSGVFRACLGNFRCRGCLIAVYED